MSLNRELTATYLDANGEERTFSRSLDDFNQQMDTLARERSAELGLTGLPGDTRSGVDETSEGRRLTSRAPWVLVLCPDDTASTVIYEQLKPLIELRKSQRPVAVVQLPETLLHLEPGPGYLEELNQWRAALELNLPALKRYQCTLLLAGTLAQIPFQVQVSLSQLHRVGRLSFSNLQHYRTYADKVVRREGARPGDDCSTEAASSSGTKRREPLPQRWLTLSLPSRKVGADPAQTLILPLEAELKRFQTAVMPTKLPYILEDHTRLPVAAPDRQEVYDQLSFSMGASGTEVQDAQQKPEGAELGLWLAATHGAMDYEGEQRRQGALSCGYRKVLGADEWSQLPFDLRRARVALLFACGSAGRAQAVSPDFATSDDLSSQRDALAPLPEAMLLCEEGPLVVVGHLNLLLTYRAGADVAPGASLDDPVVQLAAQLLQGSPVEVAFQTIEFALDQALEKLLWRLKLGTDHTETNEPFLSWVEWHNLRGWVILGDPAVGMG